MNFSSCKRCLLAVLLAILGYSYSNAYADSRSTLATAANTAVVVSSDADTVTLANGILSATIIKSSGNLSSLKYRGVDVLAHGDEYMNVYGETPGQAKTQKKPGPPQLIITQDPKKDDGAIGEIALRYAYQQQPDSVPFDLEIRFTLKRGDTGLYAWEIMTHDAKSPPF